MITERRIGDESISVTYVPTMGTFSSGRAFDAHVRVAGCVCGVFLRSNPPHAVVWTDNIEQARPTPTLRQIKKAVYRLIMKRLAA